MDYPFLDHNELVLIDYLPGSSGQLLMRLWSLLDAKISNDDQQILSTTPINEHKSTREVECDIAIPKRLTNWFLDRCRPSSLSDHLAYFEFLGTTLVAMSQKWKWAENSLKFYAAPGYTLSGYRRIYGIHTWDKEVPFNLMIEAGYGLRCISIVPETERGLLYQVTRCMLCYPSNNEFWPAEIEAFNGKPTTESIDLCTMLVDRNTSDILGWLRGALGADFMEDRVDRATEILETYYSEIVKPLEDLRV